MLSNLATKTLSGSAKFLEETNGRMEVSYLTLKRMMDLGYWFHREIFHQVPKLVIE